MPPLMPERPPRIHWSTSHRQVVNDGERGINPDAQVKCERGAPVRLIQINWNIFKSMRTDQSCFSAGMSKICPPWAASRTVGEQLFDLDQLKMLKINPSSNYTIYY